MTIYSTPSSVPSEPAAPKPVKFTSRPVVKLAGYVIPWFIFSLCFFLSGYAFASVLAVGGYCASGSSAYVIKTQCPALATDFLWWTIIVALIAVALGIGFAGGIGIQLRVWAWPITFGILGAVFIAGGGGVGWGVGLVFVVMALVPLVLEFRASVQRVFLGSFNIFGQQFKESAKAQPSFSSHTMPNPEGAIKPGIGDWAISILGFLIPLAGGFWLATFWVAELLYGQG